MISGLLTPLILSSSGLGFASALSACRNGLLPNVVVLWSDNWEEDVVVGGCRRGEVSSIIPRGEEGGARWAVAGEDELLPEGSGDLTPDADQPIAVAGGGGTNNGGFECSSSNKCLDPMELVALTVDSGGVRVAIDVLKELKGGVVLHWGVSLSCRVLILLLLRLWNSASKSGACRSSLAIHSSYEGGYPFHLMRYCFFFHRPKVLSLII